jgi:hypothetical protein
MVELGSEVFVSRAYRACGEMVGEFWGDDFEGWM